MTTTFATDADADSLRLVPRGPADLVGTLNAVPHTAMTHGVVLDLRNVGHVNSCELNALISLCLKLRTNDRQLVLINVNTLVAEVFALTRFDRLVEIQRAAPQQVAMS